MRKGQRFGMSGTCPYGIRLHRFSYLLTTKIRNLFENITIYRKFIHYLIDSA